MDVYASNWFILLLLFFTIEVNAGNDSSVEEIQEHRVPRVSGRIVKVYSGSRPEPFMCDSEGYKTDPHSCASFYRCVKAKHGKFNVFRYQCAPGTVYDPDLETCNHPRSTRRTECGGMKKKAETIDYNNNNEIEAQKELPQPISNYNELAFIKESTITPPAGSQWTNKHYMEPTVYQTQSTSPIYFADTTKYNSGYNYVMSTNLPWTSNKKEYNLPKTTAAPKVTPSSKITDICSNDGFTGDTDNCRKFYRCIGNQRGGFLRYEFFCSESTVWDEEIQSCNHPWAVKRSKCGRSITFDGKSEAVTSTTERLTKQESHNTAAYGQKINKTIQQQLQVSHSFKVTQTQTQISHSDPVIQNQTQIHYGDRINQNKDSQSKQTQTQIAHGSAVSQTQTQIDYGDKGMQTQLQIDHSKDSSQSQTQIHQSTTSQSTTAKQDSNHSNNNQCSDSGFMGDSNDCKKFYRCVDNGRGTFTKYEYLCGEGTVWDQNIEACNHAWAVKECGGQSHSETQSSTVQSTTLYADTSKTTQSTSEAEVDIDDIDVGYGNQGQSETTTISSTTSTKTTTIAESQNETTRKPQNEPNNNNECTSSGFMGDATNCKKFYRCVDNGMGGFTRHEFTCGEGTVWDPSIEACNHAWAVENCGGSGGTSEGNPTSGLPTTAASGETTTTTTIKTTPVDKIDEPVYTTTISSTSTSTSIESGNSNVCKTSGFMGDNQNCKKFYRCVDNGDGTYTRYEFTCGEGTVWDSKIDACNHEWAVETCGGNGESTTPTYSSTSQQPPLQDEEKENEPATAQSPETSSTTKNPTTTTERNDISATDQTCTSSGFIGDKSDCKKFYRCVENGNGGYDRYEFTCGEGTVWDESISACNHAWAVKHCSSTGGSQQSNSESTSEGTVNSSETGNGESSTEKSTSTTGSTSENEVKDGDCESEGFFGSLLDCKKFIRCVDDGKGGFIRYEFTCGEGTTWNHHIKACDHPSPDRPCGEDYQSTTKESHINDEMITETTTKMTSTTASSDKEESQATQKPQLSQGTCKSEGFNGDPSDCKKFYRCVDDGKGAYTKYEFTCGDGTVWSQEILACDHESDDNSCVSSGPPRPTESSGSQSHVTTSESQSESTTSSSSTTISNQETNNTPTSTNNECTSDGFFAHSNDCKKFIRCVSNGDGRYTKYEFSCGQGTVWVQEIQACDHENEDTTCSKQNEPTTKPQNQGSSSTTESGESPSTESQTQNKENDEYTTTKPLITGSDDECTSEGYFGNKNDCKKFYRCVDNGEGGYTKYDFVCGEGTAWDSNIGNCNHINEVTSCADNNKEQSNTQQTMKDEETSTTQGAQATTSTTETTSSSSESNEETGSTSETGSKDKCESEGYYGDSKDCKKFYRCVDDGKGGLTKYDFTCGEGTIWDQDITNCNHPQDVTNPSCKSEEEAEGGSQTSATSSTTSTTSSPDSTSSSSSQSTTQSSSNCSQEESSKKPGSSKDISCEKAGYYPNPNDCKKFYRCVDWDGDGKRFSVYHFECGEGTIWDPALDTCNHEDSVYPPRDCSETQAHSETSSEGTTTKKQEETTTQESTTTEQTTTQETTTSEQTTTEQEQTTTQQSIISEKTTTEQEQTTTQQSTTSEKTTTEQEQTTTQQSTTSEKTTTEQSTTSEQTTTQQTTSEQTTTQQTTSEQTTSEQTTTQQSTSEQTTTQQSTTSEQTTEESTTSEQTTEESTTSQSEQSTTSETTTTQQTTEQTSEQTESSTTEGTTKSSTTEAEEDSTTEQSSTTEGEQETTTESLSSEKECPETEDDQYLFVCPTSFRRHPKYCNMFYQCTEDDDTHEVKIATFKCPNDTIYDESQTQCVDESKADKKCDGEIAKRLRFKRLHRDSKELIMADKEKKSCPSTGYYAFEKNTECSNGFLKCERSKSGKIKGYVHQCPEGYLFWSISKRCELAMTIRDCKRSSNDWKGRWNIPVDRKNVAF